MPHETSMSAASRKAWNLKVIQRHDPDILCIWDQVSYVMLMQYSSTGWAKTSVEGSLFLFDRRGLPRYGFFILNRSASQNYIHLLTAEDNLEVQESYVIFRAKGSKDAPVLGLWAGDPDHRKHLGDTLLGLHNHIKSGSSAPFYDPATVFSPTPGQSSIEAPAQGITSPNKYSSATTNLQNNTSSSSAGPATGMQSLNDLFARLSSSASEGTSAPPIAPDNSHSPFYATSAPEPPANKPKPSSFSPPQSATSSAGPLRGQALLDSLFAMASPAPAPAAPQPTVPASSSAFGLQATQPPIGSGNFGPPATTPQKPQTTSQAPAPTGGDLLAQLFANINSTQPPTGPSGNQNKTSGHTRQPSTPPPISALPPDPAIIHSTKVTPEPLKHDRRRNNPRRGGYATDTSPRPLHTHVQNRLSVFDEDAPSHSRSTSLTGDEVLGLNGSLRSKPRSGRALVPFQSDTGPEYHPDPTRPHVSSRYPAGMNGEEEQVYAMGGGVDEEAEDEIFYDGRGGKGPSPRRQKRRQRNGRGGGTNGNGRNGDTVNPLDRQMAGEVLMQGIEWDEGVVDKQLFLQSIYALLNEQEFVDQLYNDYKIAQSRQA
ncbi:hypothetical protein FRC12_015005 [Ceratobasidium sp. 428]|nr:hypothetical protein FRC12_015005 [Ceratobasidium sp. 428]